MGQIFVTPMTEEQRRIRDEKRAAKAEQARRDDQDLINAYVLEKVAKLEAKQNDGN